MMDLLKANPHVTREDYLWKWTIPQIKLATYDSTRVEYSKSKKDKNKVDEKEYKVIKLSTAEEIDAYMASNGVHKQ